MSDHDMTQGPTPRNGYKGRPSTGSHLEPQKDANAKFVGDMPTTYPEESTPREGFESRMDDGDPKNPGIPAANVVVPKPWNENERANLSNPLTS